MPPASGATPPPYGSGPGGGGPGGSGNDGGGNDGGARGPWQRLRAWISLQWQKFRALYLVARERAWQRRREILIYGGAAFACLVVGVGLWVAALARTLPDVKALRNHEYSTITRIYDVHGDLVGEYFAERRVYVPLERMPKHLVNALLAVEDSRFYKHYGIDPVRIGGAMVANLARGGFSQGGSTITQQLARTLFLTREKKISRKIREALLALKMERVLSKDEILELYLNEIYLGNGAYGAQAAAKGYFGKDVEQLSLPEAAFIAGLPRAPSRYTPYADAVAAKNRQGVVLKRMRAEGVIDDDTLRLAYAADLLFRRPQRIERQAPYFMEEVRKHLTSVYGEEAVNQGGLSVYTTMDAGMQEAAEQAVTDGLRALDKRQGWRGPLRRLSGEELQKKLPADEGSDGRARIRTELVPGRIYEGVVVAVSADAVQINVDDFFGPIAREDMQWARHLLKGRDLLNDVEDLKDFVPDKQLAVGDVIHVAVKTSEPMTFTLEQVPVAQGALLAMDPHTGEIRAMVGGYNFALSQFNRALMARRQSGSAFKPIVYATAFSRGYTPSSIVMDTPLVFRDAATGNVWKPENYEHDFQGPIALREALVHSRNVATVKLLQSLGLRNVQAFARKLGIESDLANDLSLGLGSSSLTLMELTRAYGVFASGGKRTDPYYIRRVVDNDKQTLELAEPKVEQVITEETAYMISNVLEDVIRRGTGVRARVLNAYVGGKTGTTNDFTDAWFVGSSPHITVAVWVGMDDHTVLGAKESGARAALPIWIDFMRVALQQLPDEPFKIPAGIVYHAPVDPKTGRQVKGGDDTPEIFTPATRPTTRVDENPSMEDFLQIDMGGGNQ